MQQFVQILKNTKLLLTIIWTEDKWHVVGYFLSTTLAAVFSIASYFAYKMMIDAVFAGVTLNQSSSFFIVIASYLFSQFISQYLYSVLSQYYFDYVVRSKFQSILSRKFMHKLADLDFVHLEDGEMRNLIARAQDSYPWRLPEIVMRINYIFYNLVSLVLTFFIALQFNIWYFLAIGAVAVPFYFIRAKYGNASYSIYSLNGTKTNFLWYLRGMFTSFPTLAEIKLYGLQDYFIDKTKALQNEIVTEYVKPIRKYTFIALFDYILSPIVVFIALNNFMHLVTSHQESIGSFTLFVSIIFAFGADLANILNNVSFIYENNLYANDYFNLLETKNKIKDNPGAIQLTDRIPLEIVFENVSFHYPDAKEDVLKHVSFTIKRGDDIAIVGHNGAGKTTLIKLLLRFYDPTEGRILVNGEDLRNISLSTWYQHIGILFQDFARYDLSLKENIFLGDISQKASDEKVIDVISKAQAKDIMLQLTDGLDQRMGKWFEGSEDVSVGQWQKVAIARALFRQAPILIMDEPTANIDAEAEFAIFENLKKVYEEKTLIFISHRFSTVRMADTIFVIDKGQLAEEGSHEALMKKKGLYAKYFSLQKKGYE